MLALLVSALLQPTVPASAPEDLARLWSDERFVTVAAPCLRHDELVAFMEALAARHPSKLGLEEVGRSFQGRSIHLLTLGRGPKTVLLWSQMHGDEPSATPALLDVADFLLRHADEPSLSKILEELTLLIVPMLNPDGTEIYQRRNAQGIDINRDALNLATPEGRLLKRLRDEHQPILGFNLHDQDRRTAVGDTGFLATNAVLAVAGDPEGTMTPGRQRAKRACAAIVEALAPFMPGGMARYDEDWSPRAFGDNLTAWGTPVVLIESGGLPLGHPLTELTKLNFVALVRVLAELAEDDLAGYDLEVYENLERNESNSWSDVVVRGGFVVQPEAPNSYRADLAFDLRHEDRESAGCAAAEIPPFGPAWRSQITEIGDARFLGAGRSIDATGRIALASFEVGVEGWSARKWLDAQTLNDLARLGVGRVRWRVKPRRFEVARRLARTLAEVGRTALEVVEAPAAIPWVRLTEPPVKPDSNSLGRILSAIGLESSQDMLLRLWPPPGTLPTLRRGQPASFLLVSPWPTVRDETLDLEGVHLESIWLDGVEVEPVQ